MNKDYKKKKSNISLSPPKIDMSDVPIFEQPSYILKKKISEKIFKSKSFSNISQLKTLNDISQNEISQSKSLNEIHFH